MAGQPTPRVGVVLASEAERFGAREYLDRYDETTGCTLAEWLVAKDSKVTGILFSYAHPARAWVFGTGKSGTREAQQLACTP